VKALLVDDDATSRFILKTALGRQDGWEAFEAADGVEGLKLADQVLLDIVFLDIKMPKMDGLTMLRSLRRSSRNSRLPVVMLTGASEEPIVRQAVGLGIADYLLKPLSEGALTERVPRLLAAAASPVAVRR
jgi:DNA-binding response OmpR family regulator